MGIPCLSRNDIEGCLKTPLHRWKRLPRWYGDDGGKKPNLRAVWGDMSCSDSIYGTFLCRIFSMEKETSSVGLMMNPGFLP